MTQEPETTDGHLLKAIVDACDGRIIQMPAPMSLTAVYPDRSPPFKTIKMRGNEELILSGARIGNRQPLILKLSPMDTVDYEALELESNKVTQFLELEKHLVDSLGAYLFKLQAEAEIEDLDAPFIPSGISLNSAIAKFKVSTADLLEDLKAKRAAKAEREAQLAYADNDEWGTW
jgi:hypothetical protein